MDSKNRAHERFESEPCTAFLTRALRDDALKETRQIASHKVHTLQVLILINYFMSHRQGNHEIFEENLSWKSEKLNVKFHKNCDYTGKILKNS